MLHCHQGWINRREAKGAIAPPKKGPPRRLNKLTKLFYFVKNIYLVFSDFSFSSSFTAIKKRCLLQRHILS